MWKPMMTFRYYTRSTLKCLQGKLAHSLFGRFFPKKWKYFPYTDTLSPEQEERFSAIYKHFTPGVLDTGRFYCFEEKKDES